MVNRICTFVCNVPETKRGLYTQPVCTRSIAFTVLSNRCASLLGEPEKSANFSPCQVRWHGFNIEFLEAFLDLY